MDCDSCRRPILGSVCIPQGVGRVPCAQRFTASAGETLHVALQLPPNEPGFVGVVADSDEDVLGGDESPPRHNPFDSSAFTTDSYATPGSPLRLR